MMMTKHIFTREAFSYPRGASQTTCENQDGWYHPKKKCITELNLIFHPRLLQLIVIKNAHHSIRPQLLEPNQEVGYYF